MINTDELISTVIGLIIGAFGMLFVTLNLINETKTKLEDAEKNISYLQEELRSYKQYNDVLQLKNEDYYNEIHRRKK